MPDPSTSSGSPRAESRGEWKTDIRARLSHVSLAPAREAEIVEELAQHLDDRWHELVASGLEADEAERQTRLEFRDGNLLAKYLAPLRQAHWADPSPPAPRRWYAFGGLRTDLRDAVRSLRSTPGFTAVALIVLTLGIGATTAIFSVVDAVALRPLPFDAPEELVAVGERPPSTFVPPPGADPTALRNVQPQNYLDWEAQQTVFSAIAAIASNEVTWFPEGGEPESISVQRVSAAFFDVLRVRPAIGRAFPSDAEVDGRHRVAVVSEAFWRRRLNADPRVLERAIALDDGRYQIVGVLGPNVGYPVGADPATAVWVPYVMPAGERVRGRGHSIYLQVVARLKSGVSIGQAQAGMDRVAAGIERAYPEWNRGSQIGVRPLQDHLVGASIQSWMLMLLAAVGIVLLITCANVANLMLARASVRETEVSIRAALGAGRWRLARQFFVESLVLSTAGSLLAMVLATWVIELLRGSMPDGVPRVATIGLDLRVLAAAAAIAMIGGLSFGLLPAVQLSRPNLVVSLKAGGRASSAGRGRQRLRRALVIAEIALSVVLLVGAALFIGSFIRLMRIETGINPDRVLTARVVQQTRPGEPRADWRQPLAGILERIQRTDGVVSAAVVSPAIPFRMYQHITGLTTSHRPTMTQANAISVKYVTPDYLRALGIQLVHGRFIDDTDRDGGLPVTVLSQSAAKYFFGVANPVGQTGTREDGSSITIVGVVADVRQSALEGEQLPEMYVPMAQRVINNGFLVIRTTGNPLEVLPAVKSIVAGALPDVPLREISAMSDRLARQTALRRFNMLMLGLFALLGLVISAVGVYGVMAYLVAQRTREIGVRMALGATRPQVVSMVLRSAAAMLAAGLALGSLGAWQLAAAARPFLFGLEGDDPRAFAAAVAVLAGACLVAAIVPARRAASVDPTVALRSE